MQTLYYSTNTINNTIKTVITENLNSSKSFKKFLKNIDWKVLNSDARNYGYFKGLAHFKFSTKNVIHLINYDKDALECVEGIDMVDKYKLDHLQERFNRIDKLMTLLKLLSKTNLFWKDKLECIRQYVNQSDCCRALSKRELKALVDLSGGYQLVGTTFANNFAVPRNLRELFGEDIGYKVMGLINRNITETYK